MKELSDAGLDCVFLQFDGLREETYRALRGRELLKEKWMPLRPVNVPVWGLYWYL
ncbi:MAG: hypothetical protein ACLRMZ_05680 [Blautia marasmi]